MKSKIWLVFALLVLVSLACSPLGKATRPTPETAGEAAEQTPVSEEGAAPTPAGEEAEGEAPALEVAPDALSGLDSYRARVTSQWTPTGGAPEGMTMEEEFTREPAASRIVFNAGEGQASEIVRIGDTMWFCSGGSCSQTQQSEEDLESSFGALAFKPEDFTTNTDYDYVGRESVNGINTRHYVLKLTEAQVALLSQGKVSDIKTETWVADESGLPEFVVRYQITWNEVRTDREGSTLFSYEIYDVNAPITIEPPEGAAKNLPEDVPMYDGATDLLASEGMVMFSVADDVATVAEFYRGELAAQGWTMGSDDSFEGTVSQTWTKDDRTLNLMIAKKDEGGSSVIITLQ
jgi:hypothetical protein